MYHPESGPAYERQFGTLATRIEARQNRAFANAVYEADPLIKAARAMCEAIIKTDGLGEAEADDFWANSLKGEWLWSIAERHWEDGGYDDTCHLMDELSDHYADWREAGQ